MLGLVPARRWTLAGLVALVLAGAPMALAAHPLPPSIVAVTVGPATLGLTVSIPQGELAIVLPEAEGASPDAVVPETVSAAVGAYLARHIVLTGSDKAPLGLSLGDVRLVTTTQEDLGPIHVFVVDLQVDLPAGMIGQPLTLSYDAVLHEVRNHSATVTLQKPGRPPVTIGDIRFDPALGRALPVVFPTGQ